MPILIFYGFWTDRLSCPEQSQKLMPQLPATKIALFATAGFGEGQEYFQKIMDNAAQYLPQGATLLDTFTCTGKMPMSVQEQYIKLLHDPVIGEQAKTMLQNYDLVKGHPDKADLEAAAAFAKKQYDSSKINSKKPPDIISQHGARRFLFEITFPLKNSLSIHFSSTLSIYCVRA